MSKVFLEDEGKLRKKLENNRVAVRNETRVSEVNTRRTNIRKHKDLIDIIEEMENEDDEDE
jgi:hypothetical protein